MARRTEVADAAIATLAREGMRGLTHRAVDRTAGLPEGSTSYYFRTRNALLKAVVERLAEVDAAEIPALPNGDLDAFADAAARLVHAWLTIGRDRQLARYELTLEATRRPELREVLVTAGAKVRGMVADRLGAAGVAEPDSRAADFVALVDGLVFDQIAGAGDRELTPARLRAVLRALLAAIGGMASDPDRL
ncbi:TetR/AcrR family transcriptional regulator [Actinomadura sp. DC4]|uniref:TetR/AcrR family transcriptional regulator n=1 Tax=Actinomadura sp. DC4 TaxID=3055069 RepID=UPI0025AFFF95|nr:TetR/AcrR family transcriptional regulator [Actinomadura sp. DC4]MDN3358806.1 TetR family transcriptional regulator [Actinomadura sp. DC4]